MGRSQKPYKATWGETIDGLYRRTDGRWKIIATGELFTEHDEYTAVAKFKQRSPNHATVFIPSKPQPIGPAKGWNIPQPDTTPTDTENEQGEQGHLLDETAVWEMVRKAIIETPELAAQKLRIPQIASLKSLHLPIAPMLISTVIEAYETKNPGSHKTKRQNLKPFKDLVSFANATTLDDLTTEKLQQWKAHLEQIQDSPDYRAFHFSRVKGIVRFGLKVGLNAVQINEVVTRMAVLWESEPLGQAAPNPISREDFHRLLEVGGEKWRPWLLCGLNLCMHIKEVCGLKWSEFDLDKGTYAAIRTKTQRKKIPQAASLWPETIAALRALPKKGQSPWVFTSTHGKSYNPNTKVNDFADLRDKAKIITVSAKGERLSFDWLRDGAYTTAIDAPEVPEKFARVLAGHKSPGLQDAYVLRNAQITQSAVDAIHRKYLG